LVSVHRDFSLLQTTLKRIHPSIEAEVAPDRDAVVLTGRVPDITYYRAAENAAQNYLNAAQSAPTTRVLVQAAPPATAPPEGAQQPAAPPAAAPPSETIRVPAQALPSGTVINLIQIENLPPLVEGKMSEAIRGIGGERVRIHRVIKGQVIDDGQDLFVFEGRVPNQVALTRILTVASRVLTGQAVATAQDIRVIADEGGSLLTGVGGAGAGATGGGGGGGGGFGGGGGGLGGGVGAGGLGNQVSRNIARAKALTAAGGRILSFIEVADIPQVRVSIRLFEVNRNRLKTYSPNIAAVLGSPKISALVPSAISKNLQSNPRPVGPGNDVQTVLGFLGGTLTSETQLTTSHFALDTLLSYLEQLDIARSLSVPSMTVLSGESAQFSVGGDVPVPQAFSPAFGTANAAGVFSSVTFLNFGVTLEVRPLVGDDDVVTVDVLPQITTPDPNLTASIRVSTGTSPLTTAFQSRTLRTTARLQDGQALLVGGLLSRTINDSQSSTPGIRDVPGLGWLFKDLNRTDDTTELLLVVDPAIVRDPLPSVALWQYPTSSELMENFGKMLAQPAAVSVAAPAGKGSAVP